MAANSSRYHMATLKIVLVGAEAVGKTSLLIRFHQNSFPSLYVPTVFDSYWKEMSVDGNDYGLLLWDNSGNDDYIRLRPLSYPQTDVFLVCFDINNRESFIKLQNTWLPEVKRYQNGTPIIIVGNKMDIRSESQLENATNDFVLHVEGVRLALREGAIYCESSAKENRGVKEVFQTAVRYYNHHQPRQNAIGCCCGLRGRRRSPDILFLPPPCPPPVVSLEPSTFSEDMAKLFDNSNSETDVTLVFEDKSTLGAHRFILCCTSSLFRRIFLSHSELSNLRAEMPKAKMEGKLTSKDINGSRVAGLVKVSSDRGIPYDCVHFEESQRIFLTLRHEISRHTMARVLRYMYTGELDYSHSFEEKHLQADVLDVLDVAKTFQVETLVDLLINEDIYMDDYVDEWKNKFVALNRRLFCHKSRFSDVTFQVDKRMVPAHTSVLISRCDVMAAMLSGNFRESRQSEIPLPSVPHDGFLGFLEYIYTDEVNLDVYDALEVLTVANQFCLPRLVSLCEVWLEKKMELSLRSSKKKSDRTCELVNLIVTGQRVRRSPRAVIKKTKKSVVKSTRSSVKSQGTMGQSELLNTDFVQMASLNEKQGNVKTTKKDVQGAGSVNENVENMVEEKLATSVNKNDVQENTRGNSAGNTRVSLELHAMRPRQEEGNEKVKDVPEQLRKMNRDEVLVRVKKSFVRCR